MPDTASGLDRRRPVHLIGVGGTGLSGLAGYLLAKGFQVTGSDRQESPALGSLARRGARVHPYHNPANILSNTQIVVRSAAIPDDNPEVMASRSRGFPVVKYAEMLGKLMDMETGVAVSGTHGKTTTTSLIAYVLRAAGLDPSFIIGGESPDLGGNWGVGGGGYFVAEACEYDRSFLNLRPDYLVINNIEEDHLDCFRNLTDIQDAFASLAAQIKPNGRLFHPARNESVEAVVRRANCEKISYGLTGNAVYGVTNVFTTAGENEATVVYGGREVGRLRLRLPGVFNLSNALAAVAVAHTIGVEFEQILKALGDFRGVRRRFETIGNAAGVTVVDDYAHHPSEIRVVLEAARQRFVGRRLVTVFQPHQASRTRFLLQDFACSFAKCDMVIVPDIYFARDSEIEKALVGSKKLVSEIVRAGGNAVYIPSFEEILAFLQNNLEQGDVLITMGAGDVDTVARGILERLPRNVGGAGR